jgi:hypothetical protein
LFFVAMLAGSMFAKLVINAREEKMKTAKA